MNGYDVLPTRDGKGYCPSCGGTRFDFRYFQGREAGWLLRAVPAFLLVTCNTCGRNFRLKPEGNRTQGGH